MKKPYFTDLACISSYFLNYLNNRSYLFTYVTFIFANEQHREDARLRGGSLIEPCAIVPGAEKISNRCNIE